MKNKVRIIGLIFLGVVIIGIFFLVGIKNAKLNNSSNIVGDGGFLSEEPCGPPCFLGIVPNVTTETEVIRILTEKGLYKNCDFVDNESESGLRGFDCSNFLVSITFFRGTDIVGSVGFNALQQLTVSMVIAKYGKPDAVLVSSNWFNWEKEPTTSMSLIYRGINANIGLGEQQGDKFTLTPSTLVNWVNYSTSTFPTISENEAWAKLLSSWHDYGEYVDVTDTNH